MKRKDEVAVYTTCGEPFTFGKCQDLAHLIWIRFGRDTHAAAAAWARMLQNNCTEEEFCQILFLEKQ